MDHTEAIYSPSLSLNDESNFLNIIKNVDIVFTTPFIKEAMVSKGYDKFVNNIVEVSFPMISDFEYTSQRTEKDKTTLMYCGTLYLQSKIRSPEAIAEIISIELQKLSNQLNEL